jgi:hypothetical protein
VRLAPLPKCRYKKKLPAEMGQFCMEREGD